MKQKANTLGPPTANEIILDKLVAHATDLTRVEAHLTARVLRMLRDVERDLAAQIAKADVTGVARTAYQKARLDRLREQVRATIKTAYGQVNKETAAELKNLATIEAEFCHGVLRVAVPLDFGVRMANAEMLDVLASEVLIDGAATSEWWAAQAGDLQDRFTRAMRQGMLEGETLGQLVQRVRGTKAGGFKDGIMQISRRHAEMLVRSSVQTVANRAREKVWEANAEVVGSVVWLSTLDGRTSTQCIARDGLQYTLEEHKPIGHGLPWGAGPGSIHPSCRSTSTVRVKSWRELGFDIDELPEGTRASMDGQVPASMSYGDWLKGKPPEFQDKALGKGKAQLWREGKIGTRELLDNRGRPMSLKELREGTKK